MKNPLNSISLKIFLEYNRKLFIWLKLKLEASKKVTYINLFWVSREFWRRQHNLLLIAFTFIEINKIGQSSRSSSFQKSENFFDLLTSCQCFTIWQKLSSSSVEKNYLFFSKFWNYTFSFKCKTSLLTIRSSSI